MTNPIAQRLSNIRTLMQQHNIDYYFVPARDEHNNEYLPECWQRRSYMSGFTGSAGDVLIGLDKAYLWTDPRYFLQADNQLDSNYFTLIKQQQGVAAPIHQWLAEHAIDKRVATDPRLISLSEKKQWQYALESIGGELVSIDSNLVDEIWHDQPVLPQDKISIHDIKYSGLTTQDKLTQVRKVLADHKATAHAINLLDAIAWLFNIRGSDISYNPLAISYALITEKHATFFIDKQKLDDKTIVYCESQHISIRPYDAFAEALSTHAGSTLLEPGTASWWMEQQLTNAPIIYADSPITLMKAIKNPVEQQGAYDAHERDGIALSKLFYWLSNNWEGQTELSVVNKFKAYREENTLLKGLSFNTISGFGEHGAIIHYAVDEGSDIAITNENLFLLDSGGQYLTGTTDVTRTVHLGTPTTKQIHHYTLVLKGHLALRHAIFPHGTCGEQLNAMAHMPLWSEGLDFGHGTGHGVGSYLCVHEGPQRISNAYSHVPLVPGMIVSNEPGFYLDGQYGIRIENLIITVDKIPVEKSESGHGPFYGFDDLTLHPYARNLIDKSSLTATEIEQINTYHERVYQTLYKNLPEEIQTWLRGATEPL